MQNDITETRQKIHHQQHLAKSLENSTYEKSPVLWDIKKRIDEFASRLTNARRSLTSQASEMSNLFCQTIHFEQMQREIESWLQIKESEFGAILNASTSESVAMQQRQMEKLTVSIMYFVCCLHVYMFRLC